MSVRLRYRKNHSGSVSFFLDYNANGERQREFLNLTARREDKFSFVEAKRAAEVIRAKREIDLATDAAAVASIRKQRELFYEFVESFAAAKEGKARATLRHALRYLQSYEPHSPQLAGVTHEFLTGYRQHLLSKLAQNTAHLYFSRIKSALDRAAQLGYIAKNPARTVDAISTLESQREYLTPTELKAMIAIAPISPPPPEDLEFRPLRDIAMALGIGVRALRNTLNRNSHIETKRGGSGVSIKVRPADVKRHLQLRIISDECRNAFLFQCWTGIRVSDVSQLTWAMVMDDEIVIRQVKRKKPNRIPLNQQARLVLNLQRGDLPIANLDANVFHLPALGNYNQYLQRWATKAGIKKKVHSHIARHTFATMSATAGVRLEVLQDLLGHTNPKHTRIYMKIVDERKREAVNMLPNLLD